MDWQLMVTCSAPPWPAAAGAIEGLKSLKQARITDPTTGQSYGLVRLYADPGEPAASSKPARAAAANGARAAKHAAHRGSGGGGKSLQVNGC
jgi:hypothetical protein